MKPSHVAIGLVLACSRVSVAQGDPTQIPVPLATALIDGTRSMGLSGGRFYVGNLSPAWRAELTPRAPAVIVGGLAGGSHVIAVFNDTTHRFLAGYLEYLQTQGFTMPPREATMGGFATQVFQPVYNSGYLCRDSTRVAASAVPGATRGAFILVDYQRTSDQCIPRRITPMQASVRLELPALTPPPGLEMTQSGSSGGGTAFESTATIRDTVTTPSALAAHYAGLLVRAGWTVDAPAADGRVLIQTVHAMDKDAKPWDGILTVVASATRRQLRLSIRRRIDAE